MKKLFVTAATVVMLAGPAFADQNLENMNRMDEMRHHFYQTSLKMVHDQMTALKKEEARLTGYQRLLKQMMENELSSHRGSK